MTEEQFRKMAREIIAHINSRHPDPEQVAFTYLNNVDFAARSDKINVGMNSLTDGKVSELAKLTAKQIYTQGMAAGKKEGWNEEIDAAFKWAENVSEFAHELKEMKK